MSRRNPIPPKRKERPPAASSQVWFSVTEEDTVARRVKKARGDLWISPPSVKHGSQIITIIVGPILESNSSINQQTFSVHRNLLVASSPYFQAALSGNFQESIGSTIKLPEDIPQVFQVFYDWLYSSIASEQARDGTYKTDHFWLLVYQMADRLLVDGLKVIAYERFQACFKPVNSRILPQERMILPSDDLIAALFESDRVVTLFRVWVVRHIVWYYHSSPEKLGGMEDLVNNYPTLAAEIGKVLTTDKVKSTKDRCHPSYDTSFAENHGLNSS